MFGVLDFILSYLLGGGERLISICVDDQGISSLRNVEREATVCICILGRDRRRGIALGIQFHLGPLDVNGRGSVRGIIRVGRDLAFQYTAGNQHPEEIAVGHLVFIPIGGRHIAAAGGSCFRKGQNAVFHFQIFALAGHKLDFIKRYRLQAVEAGFDIHIFQQEFRQIDRVIYGAEIRGIHGEAGHNLVVAQRYDGIFLFDQLIVEFESLNQDVQAGFHIRTEIGPSLEIAVCKIIGDGFDAAQERNNDIYICI